MNPHHREIDALYAHLHSNAGGLTQAEAARRLARHGPNRLEAIPGQPVVVRLVKEFTHFFALILWLAAGLAFFAEYREPGQGMATLGYAVLGVILVNGLFSFWQEYRAEKALAALRELLPRHATALRDGKAVQVVVEELVPGDVVLLEAGNDVPADCRLIEALGVRVNTATLTGESRPKARAAETAGEAQVALRRDILHAGTALISGKARAMVYATGMHTEFGNIARLTQSTREPLSPLQKEIAYLSRLIALFALLLGVAFFVVGQFIGLSFWANLVFAVGIIIANVPEGLLPTVTLALAMATQRMARKNALIRHLPAVETLGATTVICSDKTGTLTQNRMSVRQYYCDAALCSAPQGASAAILFAIMRHCHDLQRVEQDGQSAWQGDPMELALLQACPDGATHARLDELPFDAERKRMSVLCATPQGAVLYCKGAAEKVLPLCSGLLQHGAVVALDEAARAQLLARQEQMASSGLRVLALAYRPVTAAEGLQENGLVCAGLVGLADPPRPGVTEAVATCHAAGVRIIMVTGDHPHTAAALAREIGLTQVPQAIEGERLHSMSDTDLQLLLEEPGLVFARTTPEQKMRIVQALQRRGEIVAVTGDGVNDAPALKCADIGIAMGVAGTDVARAAADIVLLDDNFATIVSAIEEGRAVYDNVRKFLTYILTSNIPEIVPYLAFVLFRIPLPLTVVQILAVDLGTDMLPALALGAEKPGPHVMRRPPRARNERMLNWPLLLRAYFFLGPLEALAGMAAFFFVLDGHWQYGVMPDAHALTYVQATTACLSAIIAMQVVNVWLCRHPQLSVFDRSLPPNRLVWLGIAFELLLLVLIDYTPWGNALFGTAALPLAVWLYIVPFMLGMLLLEEARKALLRRRV